MAFACVLAAWFAAAPAAPPPVLMIVVDDLNDWVGCLGGHPQAKTPAIDALAKRGTLFANAHCQAPLCNPSRTSVLSGLRPTTTGVYGLAPGPRASPKLAARTMLPQAFAAAGYWTYGAGKVWHDGGIKPKDRAGEFSEWGPAPGMPRPPQPLAKLPLPNRHPAMDWGEFPPTDAAQADRKIADAAIAALARTPAGQPWFIACGFRSPHVPCFASPSWFALHPRKTLRLPTILAGDRADTPPFSWYLHWRLPEPRWQTLQECGEDRNLVRSYLAATSYVDSEIARVLAAAAQAPGAERMIVVLWSDHGYHLGEKGITGKNTLWERSTRVPLIFAGPGIAANAVCRRPAELLDLYPTLAELAGLKAPADLEGQSLVPQLKDASAPRDRPALTSHNPGNHAVRSERHRYIRYADGSAELYDHAADPHEHRNLAAAPEMTAVKESLARWLPQREHPQLPGAAHRILTYDPATKTAVWEGKPIDPAAGPGR